MTEPSQFHKKTVENFLQLGLSYKFTATRIPEKPAGTLEAIRFVFSKPTPQHPIPAIFVTMDVEVLEHTGTTWRYALFVEGQKHRRELHFDSAKLTGKEFNETLIDKVYNQKLNIKSRLKCWEAVPA